MTDDKLLAMALSGDENEWEELHRLCLDRPIAERLGRALARTTKEANDVADAWARVLEGLHPGLQINLAPAVPEPPATEGRKKRTLRILCAEDHEQICELLKKTFSDAGHHVECFFDGQSAWQRISADPAAFDVIVTDHQMPNLDGLGMVEKIRTIGFGGRIIVHSGRLTPELERAYRALGVDKLVSKSVRPEVINGLISEWAG